MGEFSNAARTVACPYCAAEIGEPCRTPSGRATYIHGIRDRLVRDAFWWGYTAGLRDAVRDPESAPRQLAFFEQRWEEQP